MTEMRVLLMVCCVLLSGAVCAQQPGPDRSVLPITAQELAASVRNTPLEAKTHDSLLRRAYLSHLSRAAYEEYTALWVKSPNSAYANLWRASSAVLLLDQESMARREAYLALPPTPQDRPEVLAGPSSGFVGSKSNVQKRLDPMALARTCFAQAIKLDPNSAIITLENGFFLWQWDSKMEEGLKRMKAALAMSPDEPRIHLRLAEVYANHSGNAYSPDKALAELRTVLRLAPSLSITHAHLIDVWLQKKNYRNAQSEMQIYLHMIPEEMRHRDRVKWMQKAIDTGLKSQ